MPNNTSIVKAVIVGNKDSIATLKELESLLNTLHVQTEFVFIVNNRSAHPQYYLGKGKLEELSMYIQGSSVDFIAIDAELKASQISNLQKFLHKPILDRPRIILEIFAQRATTREGKLQVEIATLKRRKTELINQGFQFDQQAGFVGGKGPGEKRTELTRRRLLHRMKMLKGELKKIEKRRTITREKRVASSLFTVSLVGYTNAGKSTLFNALAREDIPTDNLLFHTLDTRTRRGFVNSSIGEVLFNDTVGFIRNLPHELIEAFKSTLEEILDSDLIIKVLDVSDPSYLQQLETVDQTLIELNASHIPSILVLNKIDALSDPLNLPTPASLRTDIVLPISALHQTGISLLKTILGNTLYHLS